MVFVGEHRVAGQAQLLGAFDLTVPVRPFDQPHHEAQATRRADGRHGIDHLQRAGLVGLDGQAKAGPARRGAQDVVGQRLEHQQRQLQPVALFGVDGQVQVGCSGNVDQGGDAWQQLGHHPVDLRFFITRMQRGQLDGQPITLRRALGCIAAAAILHACSNGQQRTAVGRAIAQGVRIGAGAFTQHVKRETQAGLLTALAARLTQGLGHVAAQHKLFAQQADGPHRGGHHGLCAQAVQQAGFAVVQCWQQALRQAQRAGRQARQQFVLRARCRAA